MKTSLLVIFVSMISIISIAQIPNNGFENWINMGTYSNPAQWGTLNDNTSSSGIYTVNKATPGNPGNTYVKITSRNVPGIGMVPGIAVSGILDPSTLKALSGFPSANRPEFFEGNWQYMAFGADQGYLSVVLTKWNTFFSKRDTIASAFFPLPGMVMSWRNFAISLDYFSGADPDSAIITASASNANGAITAEQSYIWLDNLSFTGNVVGLKENPADMSFSIYPNPVMDILRIDFSEQSKEPLTVLIYDMMGKRVMKRNYPIATGSLDIDVFNLKEGNYLLELITGKYIYHKKFLHTR